MIGKGLKFIRKPFKPSHKRKKHQKNIKKTKINIKKNVFIIVLT
jgi:hypothetical protein